MTDIKDLSKIIASKGKNPLLLSSISLQSQKDAELERDLRKIKARQEMKKDWLLFILRDVIIFSTATIFILALGVYSIFTLIKGSSSEDEKKFAISVISTIVTGLIIFITGRATATPK